MYNEEVQITSTDYLNVTIGKKINLITEPKATVGLFGQEIYLIILIDNYRFTG